MSQVVKAIFWTLIASACTGLLGPWHTILEQWQLKPVVATVNGQAISQETLAMALRQQLWRRGESWDALPHEAAIQLRAQTLEQLIDSQLIPSAGESAPAKAEEELHGFQRQLAFETNRYSSALASQRLSEAEFRVRIQQHLQAEASLESLVSLPLDDNAARSWFDLHLQELKAPRVWRVAHVFLSNHDPAKADRTEEIQRLSTLLLTGLASFDDVVAQHSEDERTKLRRGDLGWFGTSRMPADFIQAVESLRPGAFSPPVQTKLGWHLLKLIDSKPARDLTFEETREEIMAHLRNEQRRASIETVLARLRASAVIRRNEAVINATTPAP